MILAVQAFAFSTYGPGYETENPILSSDFSSPLCVFAAALPLSSFSSAVDPRKVKEISPRHLQSFPTVLTTQARAYETTPPIHSG